MANIYDEIDDLECQIKQYEEIDDLECQIKQLQSDLVVAKQLQSSLMRTNEKLNSLLSIKKVKELQEENETLRKQSSELRESERKLKIMNKLLAGHKKALERELKRLR